MAHFVGDASMPYHSTADHDGFSTGEGGIHSYFETAAVNAETPALELDVYGKVPKAYKQLSAELPKSDQDRDCAARFAACLTRALCAQSLARLPDVRKADKELLLAPSKGAAPAKRKPAEEAAPVFRPIYEEQMARSAAALVMLWREAWERAGQPDLSQSQADYALVPAFVDPDYDPEAVARIKAHDPW